MNLNKNIDETSPSTYDILFSNSKQIFSNFLHKLLISKDIFETELTDKTDKVNFSNSFTTNMNLNMSRNNNINSLTNKSSNSKLKTSFIQLLLITNYYEFSLNNAIDRFSFDYKKLKQIEETNNKFNTQLENYQNLFKKVIDLIDQLKEMKSTQNSPTNKEKVKDISPKNSGNYELHPIGSSSNVLSFRKPIRNLIGGRNVRRKNSKLQRIQEYLESELLSPRKQFTTNNVLNWFKSGSVGRNETIKDIKDTCNDDIDKNNAKEDNKDSNKNIEDTDNKYSNNSKNNEIAIKSSTKSLRYRRDGLELIVEDDDNPHKNLIQNSNKSRSTIFGDQVFSFNDDEGDGDVSERIFKKNRKVGNVLLITPTNGTNININGVNGENVMNNNFDCKPVNISPTFNHYLQSKHYENLSEIKSLKSELELYKYYSNKQEEQIKLNEEVKSKNDQIISEHLTSSNELYKIQCLNFNNCIEIIKVRLISLLISLIYNL